MTHLKTAVVSIGSNSEDRESKVTEAIEVLMGRLNDVSVSSVYETPASNGKDAPYFNAVLVGQTTASQKEVNDMLKEHEKEAGRTEISDLEGVVQLDLDLVIWGGRIVRENDFEKSYFNLGYRELLVNGAFESK